MRGLHSSDTKTGEQVSHVALPSVIIHVSFREFFWYFLIGAARCSAESTAAFLSPALGLAQRTSQRGSGDDGLGCSVAAAAATHLRPSERGPGRGALRGVAVP